MAASSTPSRPIGSDTTTHGVRVMVRPVFLPHQSSATTSQYVWAYHVRIENTSSHPARLVSRRWHIVDADGAERVVEGEGVVGQQPVIGAGAHFEYTSSCSLETPWGTMEGAYRFVREDGSEFQATIGRFMLVPGEMKSRADVNPVPF